MNLYFVDECSFVAARNEEEALALCEQAYGKSPDKEGYPIERIKADKRHGIKIEDESGKDVLLDDLFAKADKPCIIMEIEP
ncbi:MAG: hypothetical protein LKI39_02630 [Bacteroides sp.]|jgi:hypothetical protein|nr:hypothetical protein [Bacteroides sp.]